MRDACRLCLGSLSGGTGRCGGDYAPDVPEFCMNDVLFDHCPECGQGRGHAGGPCDAPTEKQKEWREKHPWIAELRRAG